MFFALLVGLPLLAAAPEPRLALFDSFYRSGSLVFGGGHVVLPLLQAGGRAAGLGRQRRVPRRLWRGAGGAGAAVHLRRLSRHGDGPAPNGWLGGLLCLVAIYLPSFLLLIGALPFWDALRRGRGAGRRCAASTRRWSGCCSPRSTSRSGRARSGAGRFRARHRRLSAAVLWRTPPWLVVILGAAGGELLAFVP